MVNQEKNYDISLKRINQAVKTIQTGGIIVLLDNEDRENEGDLVFSAELVTPEKINFLSKEARGLICLTLSSSIIKNLKLPMMVDLSRSNGKDKPAFTFSIEASQGVTTGISAADRAHTISVAVNPKSSPSDISIPGHIFPLKAKDGGVLERAGHTEGSVEIMKIAKLSPAAVICEVMNDDGTMAKRKEILEFSKKHNIPMLTIDDLISYKSKEKELIHKKSELKKIIRNDKKLNENTQL